MEAVSYSYVSIRFIGLKKEKTDLEENRYVFNAWCCPYNSICSRVSPHTAHGAVHAVDID
jgi:hypothetical protein